MSADQHDVNYRFLSNNSVLKHLQTVRKVNKHEIKASNVPYHYKQIFKNEENKNKKFLPQANNITSNK